MTRDLYWAEQIDAKRLTHRLNQVPISGPLRIEPPSRQSPGFRASGVSQCLRQTGYRLLKTPETNDRSVPDNQLAADQGTAIHTRLQEQLALGDLLYRYPDGGAAIEVDIGNRARAEKAAQMERWKFTGHVDAVVWGLDGRPTILDIKTVKPALIRSGAPGLVAKLQGYATQVSAYMSFLADAEGRQIEQAYVYVVSRGDTRDRALYSIDFQPLRWEQDAARIESASAAVARGELPDAEPWLGGCRFCPWLDRCGEGNLE